MDEDWPDDVEACLLERTDGTEWSVSEMTVRGPEVRVTARPRGDAGPPDAEPLVDEPLDRGDVVRWLDGEGDVIWTMKHLGLGGEGSPTAEADAVLELARPGREGGGSRSGAPGCAGRVPGGAGGGAR